MSGWMKGLATGRQMLLALLLVVIIFPSDSDGWPDNGTSVTPTTGPESFTGWPENGTLVISTNETDYSAGWPENGTLVISTNETDYSAGWPENGTLVTSTNETDYSTEQPDYGASVTPTSGIEPTSAPPVTEPHKTSSTPDRKVKTQPYYHNYKEADITADRFQYDYHSLRLWGLVLAAVFFLMGIFILLVGGVAFPNCRRCQRRKRRRYDIAQVNEKPVQETRKDSEVTLLDSGITAV